MKISELSERTGASTDALRHYERLGLLRPSRRPNGYRDYGESAVRDVRFIVLGRDMGFSLRQLAEALPAYRAGRLTPQQGIDALNERIAEIDRQIAAQQALRARLLGHVERLAQQIRQETRPRQPAWPTPATRKKERR
jgi:DNA-binding transcriptional MerR regulator